ncbi:MAG: CRISPR-associated endonuclease Cas1 [Venatoribacter sp.]
MSELLVIDRKHTELDIENGRLIVRIQNQKPATVPLALINQIVIATPLQLSSQLLNRLSLHNICIVFIANHPSHQTCWIIPQNHGNHARKLKQYQLVNDTAQSLKLAKTILSAKLRGHYRNLSRWQRNYPAARKPLNDARQRLELSFIKIASATSVESLLGIEGAAARDYFQAISSMVSQSYNFTGRNRRPPKDPINSLLSLCYSMAQHEAESSLAAFGLDSGLGFLHKISYGRESLACDLLETVRGNLDAWALNLLAKQTLTTEHFKYKDGACFLTKAGREKFFIAWRHKRRFITRYFYKIIQQHIKEYE